MSRSKMTPRVLGIFSLVMITVGSVDSVRNLPTTALFGTSLIFFFSLFALCFLLPAALVSAELASGSTETGGVYSWVKDAFGAKWGFFAVWFQWAENVIWYPTILSFIAGSMGFLISPQLVQNKTFLITVILCAFWGTTVINLFGMRLSARVAAICTIMGLIIPMLLIISLGTVWIILGHPLQIHFVKQELLPHFGKPETWVALTGIMLSFGGMEIATVHAGDVENPKRDYPMAMLFSTLIILGTLMFGSLSIAMVLPSSQISLVAGLMQAYSAFFTAYHLEWVLPVVAFMLVLGGVGSVNNWAIAPTRGLVIAAKDGLMPHFFAYQNRHGAPAVLLIVQAVIVSVVTMTFLLLPSVNASYWLLTAVGAQLYMCMYFLMFIACLRLRTHKERFHHFRIPGGWVGVSIVVGLGCLSALGTFIIGFFPPGNISVGNAHHYETLLIVGLLLMSLPPFLLYYGKKR